MIDDEHVSVVVPVRNGARTLPLCLSALVAQRYPPERFEILCVDNGSADDSVEVMRRFSPRVQQFSAKRRGASAARNEGIRRARHRWVAFTDCDCVPDADWLAALMRFARGPRRADLMGGRIVAYQPTTAVERFCERLFDQQRAIGEFKPPYVVSANMIASRDTLAALGAFDESFARGQDVELSYRAFFSGRATFGYVDDAIVAHVNPKTTVALWRKALQHGEAAACVVAKYGEQLDDSLWHRCRDGRRYREIVRLAAEAIAGTRARNRGASAGNERLYELIVAAGKQAGLVRTALAMRRGFS
ncbi:MAG TPA: glycosyltransferase [Casimicrobiaceae bacterium]|nr:glycosyltransferase [Casimicrobiaceae bacterium]